jgi:hypothetical protein
MHEKLTDIVFDQIDTQLNMMAHNLSENSTNVAPARIIQPPNEKVTNSGIQSENWQEMETPNNGEHTKSGTTPTFTHTEATPRVHTSIFHVLYLIDGMSVECSRYRAFYVVFQVSILFVGLNMVVVVC